MKFSEEMASEKQPINSALASSGYKEGVVNEGGVDWGQGVTG